MAEQFQFRGLTAFLEALRTAPAALDAAINESLLQSGFAVEAAAKRLVPVRTSRLRSSIGPPVKYSSSPITVVVGTNVVYAKVIEYGLPAGYPIEYRNGRATKKGRTRPYTAHSHGREGHHYMSEGLRSSIPTIERINRDAANRVLAHIKGV